MATAKCRNPIVPGISWLMATLLTIAVYLAGSSPAIADSDGATTTPIRHLPEVSNEHGEPWFIRLTWLCIGIILLEGTHLLIQASKRWRNEIPDRKSNGHWANSNRAATLSVEPKAKSPMELTIGTEGFVLTPISENADDPWIYASARCKAHGAPIGRVLVNHTSANTIKAFFFLNARQIPMIEFSR